MTTPIHDHTTPDITAPDPTSRPERPATTARVEIALTQLDQARASIGPVPTSDTRWVAHSMALARLSARRAGWWRVLLADNAHTHTLHPVHARAVDIAYHRARQDARFWRDAAADWQARADLRPTSDAAGAVSNWAALGVTG